MPDDTPIYGFGDEPPKERKHRPMPGDRRRRVPWEMQEETTQDRLNVLGYLPVVAGVVFVLWVGLVLGALFVWKPLGFALAGLGVLTIIGSEVYYVLLLVQNERAETVVMVMMSSWFRSFYDWSNWEDVWLPWVMRVMGVLMIASGLFLALRH